MSEHKTIIDLNDDELRTVTKIQRDVQAKYLGKMPSVQLLNVMEGELRGRLADAGFEVSVQFIPYGVDLTKVKGEEDLKDMMLIPQVTFIGRTDKQLEKLIQTETDFERKTWDAKHTTTKELADEGVNLDLLE